MRKLNMGWMMALALGLAVPSFSTAFAAHKREDRQERRVRREPRRACRRTSSRRLAEHNKLRMEIKKVKYPAAKATIVSHVKGIKADDKKWFSDTLPDKTYESADDVFSALGWEAAPARRSSPRSDDAAAGRRAGDVDRRLHAPAPARQPRRRWRASSAGGSSSARRRCSNRSTGATTRATRRWWCCRAIRASRSAICRSRPSASPTSASARPTRAARTGRRCADQPFLVEPNPDWPDNVRVDVRDTALAGACCCARRCRA